MKKHWKTVLILLAVGFAGYVAWRVVAAVLGAVKSGEDKAAKIGTEFVSALLAPWHWVSGLFGGTPAPDPAPFQYTGYAGQLAANNSALDVPAFMFTTPGF